MKKTHVSSRAVRARSVLPGSAKEANPRAIKRKLQLKTSTRKSLLKKNTRRRSKTLTVGSAGMSLKLTSFWLKITQRRRNEQIIVLDSSNKPKAN